jgi:hypothetical protein
MLRIGQDVFGFIRGLKIELICIKISPLPSLPNPAKDGTPFGMFSLPGAGKGR